MTTLQNLTPSTRKNYFVNGTSKLSLTVTGDGFGNQAAQHVGIEQMKDTYSIPHRLSDYELISPYDNTIEVYYLNDSNNQWVLYKTHTFNGITLPANPPKLPNSVSGGAVVDGIMQYESGRSDPNSPSKLLSGGLISAYNLNSPSKGVNIGLPESFANSSPALLPSFWKFEGTKPFALYTNDERGEEYAVSGWNRNTYNRRDLNLFEEYADRKGFHSDQNKLTDSNYWQEYSYSILSSISIRDWEYAYKKMVHPAGLKLFSVLFLEGRSDNRTLGSRNYNVFSADNSWIRNLYLADGSLFDQGTPEPYNNGYLPLYQPGWLDEVIQAFYYLESLVTNEPGHTVNNVENGTLDSTTYNLERNFSNHADLGVNGYFNLHVPESDNNGQGSTTDQRLESRYHIEIRGEDHTDNSPSKVATSGYFDLNLKSKFVFNTTDFMMSQEGLLGTRYLGNWNGDHNFFNTATKSHSSNDTPQLYSAAAIGNTPAGAGAAVGSGLYSYQFNGEFYAPVSGDYKFHIDGTTTASLRMSSIALSTHQDKAVDDGPMEYTYDRLLAVKGIDGPASTAVGLEGGKYYAFSFSTRDDKTSRVFFYTPNTDRIAQYGGTGYYKNVLYRGTFNTDQTLTLPSTHGTDQASTPLRFVSWYQELAPTAAEQLNQTIIPINAAIDELITAELIDPIPVINTGQYQETGESYTMTRRNNVVYKDHFPDTVKSTFKFLSTAVHDSPAALPGESDSPGNRKN